MQEIKSRKDFYENDIDLDRANEMLTQLISKCNLKEIFWILRNISYDQVAYWSQTSHSKIYDEETEGKRTNLNVEQANRLQQQLSSIIDLYEQAILDKREFDEGYLKDYEFARPYLRALEEMRNK